jgi:hypothetical protein
MAISSYSELQGAVNDYLVFTDIGAVFDTFLGMAEARLNREIRTRELESVSTFNTQTAQEITLPTGYLEMIDFYETGSGGRTLSYLNPGQFWSLESSRSGTAQPKYYTIIGDEILLSPIPGSPGRNYQLHFYQELTGLSTSNTTNALLSKAPDLYLYATLLEAQPYLADQERAIEFAALYDRAKESLIASDVRSKLRPGARMKTGGNPMADGNFRVA